MMMDFPHDTRVYTTRRGLQLCGDSVELLASLPDQSVDLVLTSPPFALLRKKTYGNEEQDQYVEWLGRFGGAAYRVLKESGSFVLDLGGAYQRGRPVRSLYNYRVLLDFCDRLGYELAEEFFWFNPAKLPSPIEWVNKRKIRAKDAMNETRSSTQGGRWARSSSSSRRPVQHASTSSRRPSPMRARMRQLVLSSGRVQTLPVQPPSCRGTRMVTWCTGRRRAPVFMDVTRCYGVSPSCRRHLSVAARTAILVLQAPIQCFQLGLDVL